jgi:hypothetical protein
MTAPPLPAPDDAWKRKLREAGWGLGFWLAFLLVLEPGNLVRAARMGLALTPSSEVLRITCASLFGAAVTPGVFWLSRRLPVRGPDALRNSSVLAGGLIAIAFGMVLTGAIVSNWMPPSAIRGGIGEQVAGNLLLLVVALALLAAAPQLSDRRAAAVAGKHAAIPVKRRGETLLVEPGEIDWIEAQGNYLALHVGAQPHLIRGVLGTMEAQLDAGRFVRIHRRSIVNLERIRRIRAATSGDAFIDLDDGSELRVSRSYAKALKDRLPL